MKKSLLLMALLAPISSNCFAQDAAIGYRGEVTNEEDGTSNSANYGEVQLRFRYLGNDKDGLQFNFRTSNRLGLGLGANNDGDGAGFVDFESRTLGALETGKLGNFRFLFGADAQIDAHRSSVTAPYDSRFRPVGAGTLGARYQGKTLDLMVLPHAGWNFNSWAPVVGGRVMFDTKKFFADITTQYEFAKDFNSRNSDVFMFQMDSGVKLVCTTGSKDVTQNVNRPVGICVSLYGEVEHWRYNRVQDPCSVCGRELTTRDETSYGFGLRLNF